MRSRCTRARCQGAVEVLVCPTHTPYLVVVAHKHERGLGPGTQDLNGRVEGPDGQGASKVPPVTEEEYAGVALDSKRVDSVQDL